MKRWKVILREVELDYLERVNGDLDQRLEMLPLTDINKLGAIAWNMLSSEKYRSQISASDFDKVFQELVQRVLKAKLDELHAALPSNTQIEGEAKDEDLEGDDLINFWFGAVWLRNKIRRKIQLCRPKRKSYE